MQPEPEARPQRSLPSKISLPPLPQQASSGRQATTFSWATQVAEKLAEERAEKPRYEEPDKALEYYRLKRVPPGEQELPVEKYFTAKTQMEAMPQYATAQNRLLPSRQEMRASRAMATPEALGTWAPLGPGNIGGRTRALLIHPTSPNVMYAAGVAGGVWKTIDSGASWQPLTDLLANIAVSSLAFAPGNPNVTYAGTGEGFFNYHSIRGAGIFKTSDGGSTWQQMANTLSSDFYYVNDIVVSPNNAQRLYAATGTGVWRSTDGGASWTKTLDAGNLTGGALDLVIRTDRQTDYVFASCGTFEQASIYRNSDATTNNWSVVLSEAGMGRTSLALAPSNQNVIYALAATYFSGPYEDGLYAVFRSASSGDTGTWTKQTQNSDPTRLNTLLLSNTIEAVSRDCGYPGKNEIFSQGWYDNVIAVDPTDENRVWAGGTDLFRSDDGGSNWGLASHWWAEKTTPQYAHADQHTIAFHPQYNGTTNKQMFVGNDGGVFRTDDARAAVATGPLAPCNPANSKVVWQALNNNYAVTQFYHGAVAPDGKSYVGGTQDNGTVRGSEAKGANGWDEILGGDGGFAAFDPTNPQVIYASLAGGRLRKSTDGGLTFGTAEFGLDDANRFFVTPVVIDPSDPQRLWTGGNYVWRSDKGAAQWKRAANQAGLRVTAIAVSPSDANYVLVGGNGLGISRTSNALLANSTAAWPNATPRQGFISGLAFDPTNPDIAYATYSTFGGAHVWKTLNGGASWSSMDGFGVGALPDIPVHCIVIDPTNPVRLYVGTDLGVFASTNGGASWNVENTGFANAPVESLSLNTVGGVTSLYAFTHGRGAWRIALGSGCQTSLVNATPTVAQSGVTGTVAVTSDCNWTATVNPSGAGWITITGTTGNAISYSVAANTTDTPRTGTVTIGGRSFSIIQPNRLGAYSIADTVAPTLTITTPDPTQIFKSNNRFVELQGTASDDQSVVEVYVLNDRTGAKGVLNFTATNGTWQGFVQINAGVNPLTVVARDEAGNLGTAKVAASYSVPRTIISYAGASPPLSFGQFGGDGGPSSAAFISGPRGIVIDAAGNVLFVDAGNQRVRKINTDGIITTIVGNGIQGFSGDGGQATNASLNDPQGLALDRVGNLYIADEGNRRVRKVTPQGIISTVAGNGNNSGAVVGDGGLATQAELARPRAVAADAAGNLYIGDFDLQRIRKVTAATGVITTFAGAGPSGSNEEGAAALAASLGLITDLVFDSLGNLYLSQDGSPSSRVKKISLEGKVTTFSNVNSAMGLAVDKDDNLYVISFTGAAAFKVTPNGTSTMIAGGNYPNGGDIGDGGPPLEALLRMPVDVAVDAAGSVYISDALNNRLRKVLDTPTTDSVPPSITITGPTTGLIYTTTAATLRASGTSADNVLVTHVTWSNNRGGSGVCVGAGGWATSAFNPFPLSPPPDPQLQPGLNVLTFTAWDLAGNARSASLTVNFNPPQTAATFAGNLLSGYSGDNALSSNAQIWRPENVTTDAAGNLYIADRGNHVIRKVTPDGLITTFAGTGQLGSSGDGGLATAATFNEPTGLAFDAAGNLYIADSNNHRIRKITPQGMISTVVGTGTAAYAGDGGSALQASLNLPIGVTLDKAGNLYIADAENHRIRKVTTNGVMQSIAGVTLDGYTGDGGLATQAQLSFPTSAVVDETGNVFIADTGNHRVCKINPAGIIATVLGTGSTGASGDGGAGVNAMLNAPGGLALDAAGNLYVADQNNHRIRRLGLDGKVTTVVGSGTQGAAQGSGDAATIQLNTPAGVNVDRAGTLYIADTENHRVIKVRAYPSLTSVSAASYTPNRPVAPEMILSTFGPRLALSTKQVTTTPLPTELEGVKIKVKDSAGTERLAPLFFISPLQVNYLVPSGTALGLATITLLLNDVMIATEAIQIVASEPAMFAATQSGTGAAAGSALYVTGANRRSDSTAVCDANGQNCLPRPIDVTAASEVYLELYGTGLRNNGRLASVSVTVGGVAVPVLYAGPQPQFIGLDQVNVQLPRSLAGRGEVDLVLTVEGKTANPVRINLR